MALPLPEWDVDYPESQRSSLLSRRIDGWIRSPALANLAEEFGGIPPHGETSQLLAWFDDFSGEVWDFRRGRERNLAAIPTLSEDQRGATLTAATELGLVASPGPSRAAYDHCLILGGLVRACITRPRYAALLASSGVSFGNVVALGGFRPLGGDEVQLAERLEVPATNEFAAMDFGLRKAFAINEEPQVQLGDGSGGNHDWRVHEYRESRCQVVAAPSSAPESRRANSADTFVWWARRTAALGGSHILLITNPIYVPYQGAAATQILAMKFNVQVETVGISGEAADMGRETQAFEASNYLQEIRSGIRGMRSLLEAAVST